VSLPTPAPGLIFHYNFLWADDAVTGKIEAEKARPAAVVLTVDTPSSGDQRVYVLAITHSAPQAGTEAIEIPSVVARKAGLDAGRSWIILSDSNSTQ
jgi:hypothetical protein